MTLATASDASASSTSTDALNRAFNARHIAVFGASATPGKWGYAAVDELLKGGYDGKLTLVNPRGGEAFGYPLVTAEEAQDADLAIIATPGSTLPALAALCGELSIPTMVCYASGFAEVGNVVAQRELLDVARAANVRIFGPNCVGFSASLGKVNVTLDPGLPAGNVSVVTQSGSVGLHVGHRLAQFDGGFDVMVTLGNKADIGFTETVEALMHRQTTEAIVLYLERLDEGDAFLDTVARAAKALPVVALLSGQTEVGRRATMSHTGSLVGNWERARSLLEDSGVTVFERMDALAGAVAGSRRHPKIKGRRIYTMCDGGGPAVMLSDALGRADFELATPSMELGEEIATIIDPKISRTNPLDFAGAADADIMVYSKVYDKVAESGEYDAIVIGGIVGGIGSYWGPSVEAAELEMVEAVVAKTQELDVPLIIQSSYATDHTAALGVFRGAGIPCVEWPDEIANALTARVGKVDPLRTALARGRTTHEAHFDEGLVVLTETLVQALEQRGISHALGCSMKSDDDAPTGAHSWVLRLDGIAHKTDAGAIAVGVTSAEVPKVVGQLEELGRQWTQLPIVRVAPFVTHKEEIIVTFFRSADEGSGVVIGAGGTNTEKLADVATGRLPRAAEDVRRLLARSKEGRGILGKYNDSVVQSLIDAVLSLAEMFTHEFPDLLELEINPLGITDEGAVVLDVLPTRAPTS